MDNSAPNFESVFNMGISKLWRLHNLLQTAHTARIQDSHMAWKVALDAIYSEIWAYLIDSKKKTNITTLELDIVKKQCQEKLLRYLRWSANKNTMNAVTNHTIQMQQIQVEDVLDEYNRLLVRALKDMNMDMPRSDDITKVAARGRGW